MLNDLDLTNQLHELVARERLPEHVTTAAKVRADRRLTVRRWAAATSVAATVSAAGAAVLISSVGATHPRNSSGLTGNHPGRPQATTSVTPVHLPPGVTPAGKPFKTRLTFTTDRKHAPIEQAFAISGIQNQDTRPRKGQTSDAFRQHPATHVTITFSPATPREPLRQFIRADGSLYRQRFLVIAGNRALLTVTKGYGVERIDWFDADGYHLVSCVRMHVARGPSGLPASQLIRMARNLYPA